MAWLSILLLYFLIWSLAIIVIKSIVHKLPRAKALSLQFFICAGLVWIFALVTKAVQFEQLFLLISVVGFVNAFGFYCQWRAIGYSISKTALISSLTARCCHGACYFCFLEKLLSTTVPGWFSVSCFYFLQLSF